MKSDNTHWQTVCNITSDVIRELTTIQPYCVTCIQTQTHLHSQFSLTYLLKLFDVVFSHYGRHILQEFQHPCNVPIETRCHGIIDGMDCLLYCINVLTYNYVHVALSPCQHTTAAELTAKEKFSHILRMKLSDNIKLTSPHSTRHSNKVQLHNTVLIVAYVWEFDAAPT